MGVFIWLVTFLILVSSAVCVKYTCDRCTYKSNVTLYETDNHLLDGACGYGIMAVAVKGGRVAGANPSIYNLMGKGGACGVCYQVRCKNKKHCKNEGTTVIVTDLSVDASTAFVLSRVAFYDMFTKAYDKKHSGPGRVEVEYQRVPCNYGTSKNMSIRIENSSNKKHEFLAVKILFQGGQTEISSIGVVGPHSKNPVAITKNYGAVWDTNHVPGGPLKFNFVVTDREGRNKAYSSGKEVIPGNWTNNGKVYDTGIQITDIAPQVCSPCSDVWKPQY